ncbi:hypothetical protein KDA14_06215 [Candidatus Saccharibacteria bacterium]|nr:hypothetical protein [Candidatus Saccharibacteria bacterium]
MILQGLSLPEGFTVMMGGANGRQQITPHSDLDIAATAVDPAQLLEVGNRYRDAIYKLLTVLKIHGEIDIDVLQEI